MTFWGTYFIAFAPWCQKPYILTKTLVPLGYTVCVPSRNTGKLSDITTAEVLLRIVTLDYCALYKYS